MKTKKIFLLRHARHHKDEEDSSLINEGIEQASLLAEAIKKELKGSTQKITIWTSPANRAKETAQIIQQKLQVQVLEIIEHKKLWSGIGHGQDFCWLKKQLNDFEGEILIIISHLEYVQSFPREFGFHLYFPKYAEGVLITNNKCENFYFD